MLRPHSLSSNKKYYPLIYICSPFAGDIDRNIENARKYSGFALERGNIPIAPHLLFPQFMSEEKERTLAMHFNYVLLGKCKEIWVFGEKVSCSMAKEIDIARKRKMKMRWFNEKLREVVAYG